MRPRSQSIWSVALALLLSAGCAGHLSPRLLALNTASSTNKGLALVQDLEAQVCWDQPSAPAAKQAKVDLTKCSTDLATRVGLTQERHQEFNHQLDTLFGLHLKMSQDLRLWTAGLPVPVSVQEFADASSRLSSLLHQLAAGSPKIQALLDEVQALITSGQRIIQALKDAKS